MFYLMKLTEKERAKLKLLLVLVYLALFVYYITLYVKYYKKAIEWEVCPNF